MARTSLLPKDDPPGQRLADFEFGGRLGQSSLDERGLLRRDPGVVLGPVARQPIPDGAGRQADDRADPERGAPSVMQNDIGDQRRRDAGARAHAGKDDAVGQAALLGWNPVGHQPVGCGKQHGFARAQREAHGQQHQQQPAMPADSMAVSAVKTPHQRVPSARMRRGPKRSARRPAGA
jgi:hypothetical protein